MIYVGSAEDTRYDQVLEEVDVGPIPIGVNKFVLTAGTTTNKPMTKLTKLEGVGLNVLN